ncbi:hypothetical protein JX265_008170 [Neoarthrinium moseri]|uniref:CREG-like beta-barrel domain-containing protein n=1 Tax=Neoarthrinium moseri TaxID=1658444 RepID=A0A9P9WII2_9PEZI|nr:uncharacterized protein JN550_004867 [Neoarthrinium moseri]KAI1852025.1 hypothetical protein JX266_002878 [Neoarthrinium moseri]KAI1865123.1 hypothetical protein JX265_008170 [Neoarthrinium moseri]KAI1870721.1 hypothetical protein JN550_004867 [Neoarthrinium moseri]
MKLSRGLLSLTACTSVYAAGPVPPQHFSSSQELESSTRFEIPTRYESAVLGRRILALTPLGVLSTVFPSASKDEESSNENRPAGLGGVPVGLMDYVADCEDSGDPTILAINIATSFKNVAAGSNISLALQWTPPHPPEKRIKSITSFLLSFLGKKEESERQDPVPYSAANLPRFSLIGYLEKVPTTPFLSGCFVKAHPDAKYWLPGNRIHESEFVRLVVQQIYWIGGFGDRAYIGWLDPADWKNITREDWENVKLPGEKKGWKEWSIAAEDWKDL